MTNPNYFDKVKSAKDTQVGGDHYKEIKNTSVRLYLRKQFELVSR
jgi:hypothetical protein